MELTTDTSDEMHIELGKIQMWNKFIISNYTKVGNKLIITLEPTQPPLDVDCETYTITIPKNTITTTFAKNNHHIIGNFQVVNCPQNSNP